MGQGGVKVHTGTTVSFVPVVCMLNTAAQTWDRQMQHVQKGKRLFFLRINHRNKGNLVSFKDFSSNLGRLYIASLFFDFYKTTGDKSHKI